VQAGNVPSPTWRAYDRAAARLVGVTAAIAAAGAAIPAMHELSTYRLDNGLTVVHAARPGAVAAIEVWIGAGAADEPVTRGGVAHAVEHMLFRSTRGGAGVATAIGRLGGEVNAWTALDHTVVHAAVPAPAVAAGLAALADAVVHPRLSPDELDAERGVIAAELRHLGGDRVRAAAHAVFRQLFLVHPYRRPVVGTPASIATLGAHDLETFFRTWYVAAGTVVVVAAPTLDPATLDRSFGAMASRPVARATRAEPAQTALRISLEPAARGASYLALGVRTAGAADPDRAALDAIAAAIGSRGFAAGHHVLRDAGALIVSGAIRGRVAHGAGALGRELGQLAAIDDAAVARAVARLEMEELRAEETAGGLARQLGIAAAELDVVRLPVARVGAAIAARRTARRDRRRALSASAVRAVARDRLRSDRVALAALAPGRASARPVEHAVRRALAAKAGSAPISVSAAPVSVSAAPPSVRRRTRAKPAPAVIRTELANGLVVLVKPDPGAPIVAMRAMWAGGSRLEDDATAGATALLAAAITRGCGERAADAADTAVAELGGVLAGTAGRNGFGLRAEWPAQHWQRGLELVADCVLAPRLAAADVAAARRDQLATLATLADDPTRTAFRLFSETLYGDHPYRLDPLGTTASVAAATRDDLLALHHDRHPVSRLVLAIVGDVDPAAVLAAVRARFATAARPRRLGPRIAGPALDGRAAADREVYAYRPLAEAQVVIGFPGALVAAADRHAVAVLAAILDGPAGRLFAELRDRRGLAYRIGVHAVDGVDPGYLAIHVACAPRDVAAVVAAVRGELDHLLAEGAAAAEVARARGSLIGAHARAAERRADVAHGLAFAEAHGLGWSAWARQPADLAAVTTADVAAAARRYLRWDRAVVATVRPPAPTPGAVRRGRGKVESARKNR
jgi:zinc protease